MTSYSLKLCRLRHPTTVKELIGTMSFEAADNLAAIHWMEETYRKGLADSEHAALFDEVGKLVWEKAS